MKSRYQFSYLTKQVLTLAVYVVFLVFIIKNIISASDSGTRFFNILILILFGVPAILYEFLRYNFDSATKKTIFEGRPLEALDQIKLVEKYDFLKTFRTSCEMLRMLCLIDTRKFDELKAYIKSVRDKGIEDYDVEILSHYADMVLNGEEGNKSKMISAFENMVSTRDIKDKKGRRRKGAFFFNWNVVNGEKQLYSKEYKGAWHYLKVVNEETMNKREAMHYFIDRAKTTKALKMDNEYKTYKERAIKAAGKNQIMIEYINNI